MVVDIAVLTLMCLCFNVTSSKVHGWRRDCLNISDVAHFASLSLSPQSFNAPPRSKMKLWKGATFAFMLCAAALSTILIRNMATIRQFKLNTKYPSSPSSRPSALLESASKTSPPSSSSPSSESRPVPQQMGDLHRRKRSTDDMKSFLSECKISCCFHLHKLVKGFWQNTQHLTLLLTEQV